jgi:predicted metal-dependent phosphoesterase TrpH
MVICFSVYSLFEDLYARRPYKGDFHAHSNASDGKECPEINAANYRKNGYDFYSLTDHHRYWPSVQCKAYYDAKPVDFRVFHGEEVHSPGNHVHIINFGGRYSVNEIFEKDPEAYEREVRQIQDTVTYPEGFDHSRDFIYAACLWVFRKIREAGGLAIFAHPHWKVDTYNVSDNLSDALFRSGEFSAFELLGGQEISSNNLQTAFNNEKRAQGINVAIVGSSDSHGTEPENNWFNWFYTIVFSKELELEDIKEAVLSGYSSAVDKYPGEQARVHGSYRMTLYARFLLEEYFPLHEELCFEEGRLMKDMFLGDAKAEEMLKLMRGRTDALLKQYWGC